MHMLNEDTQTKQDLNDSIFNQYSSLLTTSYDLSHLQDVKSTQPVLHIKGH